MAGDAEHPGGRVLVPPVSGGSRRRRQWTALLREPGTALGLFLVVSLLLAGLLSPWLPLDDPTKINLPERLLPPSAEHLLGTDHLGQGHIQPGRSRGAHDAAGRRGNAGPEHDHRADGGHTVRLSRRLAGHCADGRR